MTDKRVYYILGAVALYFAWREWPAISSAIGIGDGMTDGIDPQTGARVRIPRLADTLAVIPTLVAPAASGAAVITPISSGPGVAPAALNPTVAGPVQAPSGVQVTLPAETNAAAQTPADFSVQGAPSIIVPDYAPVSNPGRVGITDPAPSPVIYYDPPPPPPPDTPPPSYDPPPDPVVQMI